ncbi:DUF6421 family protein [Angustibacter aerolatus]
MTSVLPSRSQADQVAGAEGPAAGRAGFARVLFDESHSQAWSVRPEVVARMNPGNPDDAGYLRAADLLRRRGMSVEPNVDAPLSAETLADADVLVLAHPSDERWERTTRTGSPVLTIAELDAVEAWVRAGGGLVVLAECEQDKYGNNLAELVARFGVRLEHGTVQDRRANLHDVPTWVRADLPAGRPPRGAEDVLAGVREVCAYRSGWLSVDEGGADAARVLARTSPTADPAGAPLVVAVEAGAGRVVVAADSDLFGDDSIGELDHAALWQNLAFWLSAGHAVHPTTVGDTRGIAQHPAWLDLKAAITQLRTMQSKDGSVDAEQHDLAAAQALVTRVADAVRTLTPEFAHDADYLAACVRDLETWRDGGLGVPDFLDSLVAFHPELQRVDGCEHLVVFPMYTQNGNPDRDLEAVIVRVAWPEHVERLERRYDNPMFLPIQFVDFTEGYDTNSAVLFPETVAVRETPRFTWGGIFADREAARFRAVSRAASETLGLALPPDAARLLDDQQLAQDAFILWDLIHDRTHSHGDLPFDPFMIKQRMPYWMYSLEELRCDLTTYREAVRLEGEGEPFGRLVQYTILFDRLFRFPITGDRVRNYDGLGGQLLFAYLRRHGALQWTDNTLQLDWTAVPGVVTALCADVERLYSDGIDRSRVAHWLAAHQLVATYVQPNPGSTWAKGVEALPLDGPVKPLNDAVMADEFPLNTFYEALRRKLADVVTATAGITGSGR